MKAIPEPSSLQRNGNDLLLLFFVLSFSAFYYYFIDGWQFLEQKET